VAKYRIYDDERVIGILQQKYDQRGGRILGKKLLSSTSAQPDY
jgi:hypothetical protein